MGHVSFLIQSPRTYAYWSIQNLSNCILSWSTAQQVRAYLTESEIHGKSGFLHSLQKADQLLRHRLRTGDKEMVLRTITALH